MKKARFVPAARREFLTEATYYNEVRPNLGSEFIAAVEAAIVRALRFPLSGSPSSAETYRVFVKGFPFSIFYRPDNNGILIFAIAHSSRKPNYWKDSRL
jgi:plasmid stabilization system protein ParE